LALIAWALIWTRRERLAVALEAVRS